jgi:tricorn protease
VRIQPLQSETELNYLDYVLRNRERVDKLSNGRFAYVHVPDMGAAGIREFIKWYYGQVRKDGLILDDRNNGGGNVSQMLIERIVPDRPRAQLALVRPPPVVGKKPEPKVEPKPERPVRVRERPPEKPTDDRDATLDPFKTK